MHRYTYLLLISLFISSCKDNNKSIDNTIDKQLYKINSIAHEYTNNSDLQALKEVIGDSRIVLLGEQSHGGGTTYKAKVRLVKFLHEEMGFDVFAIESGMYDCAKIWQQMQSGNSMESEVINSMFYMYAKSNEVKPLFAYIDAQLDSERPLLFSGIDSQHTGEKSQNQLVSDLKTYLDNSDPEISKAETWELFKRKVVDIVSMKREVSNEEKATFYGVIEDIKVELRNHTVKNKQDLKNPLFWMQIIESIESQAKRYWGDIEDMDRDRQMSDNLSWQLNNPFKDKKVIVWAHNFHIARGIDPILPMGHYLKKEFKDNMYAIGFRGYDGEFINFINNQKTTISKSSENSIEQAIKNKDWKYAFLDFKQLNKNSWLKQEQAGRLLNFNEEKRIFSNIFDGLFYIQTTTPTK